MKKSKLLLILCLVVVLALGVLVSCKDKGETCEHESYGAWQITKAPTTTDTGTAIRVCTNGDNVETVTVAKLSDTSVWTAGASTATHEAAGKITYTSIYGSVDVAVDRLSNHNGRLVEEVAVVHNATTLTNGTKAHYKCDGCGKLFSDAACTTEVTADSLVIVAAHTYGNWTLIADATCTTDGSVTGSCACGSVDTLVIPAHNHDYSSGLMVVVTDKDVYQDDDGSIVEGDEEATEFHAPVCDICKVIDKSAKVAHTYGDWECLVEKDINGHDVHEIKTCSACNHISFKTDNYGNKTSLGYLEIAWTVDEEKSVAATYTSDGYTVYTKDNHEVKLVLPKLPAPYDNKTYIPMEIYTTSEVNAGTNSLYLLGTTIALDNKGNATGGMQPFMGDIVITMVDAETGAITLTVGENTFVGFVEPSTGIMVISKDNYKSVYLLSPYAMVRDNVVASYWNGAIAIDYHIDCGTYLGHDIGILVHNDNVYFGVDFAAANGDAIVANDCYRSDMLVVTATNGDAVALFVKNSEGMLQAADEYRGMYSAMAGGDKLGDLFIDGIGGFVLSGTTEGTPWTSSGIYSASETENVYDAYVVKNGNKIEYYVATIDVANKTVTLVPQTITISFIVGEHGADIADMEAFANCVVTLPTPTPNSDDVIFVRWKNGNAAVTANTTFNSNVELTAVWATSAELTIVDGNSTTTQTISVVTPIVSALPAHEIGKTVNTANNTVFSGWYLKADFSGDPIDDDMVPGDDMVTVYAKWEELGTWTIVGGTYNFVYDTELGVWKSDNWHEKNSEAILKIIANGKIVVSFEYAASAEGGSYDLIYAEFYNNYNGSNRTEIGHTGAKVDYDAMTWLSYSNTLTVDQAVQLRYKKDGSGDHNEDRGFIRNLKINGRDITLYGTVDFLEGTYTSAGKDDLVLNGYGSYTWGDKSGSYVKTGNNAIGLYIAEEGVNTEYYAITLDGTTYSAAKPDVEVSYNFGEINHSLAADSTNANIAFTLPTEGLDVDGYVFRGWYDNAEFAGDAITTVIPSANTVVYAKYDAAATIIYNYNVNGVADKNVTGKYVNDKVETLEEIGDVANPGKVFVGWFLKNGADDDDWGTQLTANTVIAGTSLTVYARWETPHVVMGIWKGYRAYANYFNTTATTITIDAFGNVTSTDDTLNNATANVGDAGAISLTKSTDTYYAYYDATNGLLVIASSKNTAGFATNPYVLKKVDSADVETSSNSKFLARWDGHLLDTITIGETAITFVTDGTRIYVNPTVVAVDKEGVAITGTNYLTLGNQITVTYGDTTDTLVYIGSNSDFKVATDTNRGVYTDATRGKVILDGIGNIWIGTENTITGTYTVVEAGKVSTIISKVYYEVVLSGNTCVVTAPTAEVTYVVEHGTIEGGTTVNVGINVEFTLPTVTVDAGYQFAGWYLSTDTAFANPLTKYTLTSTAAISIVAKIDAIPAWATAATAEAITMGDDAVTIEGATNASNKAYFVKLVIPADGLYYVMFVNCEKTGGSAANANYARVTVFNDAACTSSTTVAGLKEISSGSMGNATLTEGTYYLVVSLGGQVSYGSNNYDAYGTFTVIAQKATHATAATAITYTVGETVTAATQTIGSKSIQVVYAVTLETGKNYTISYTSDGNAWMPISVYSSNTLSGTTVAKPAGSWNNGDVKTQDFTVSTTGTYYIVIATSVPFSIVEA